MAARRLLLLPVQKIFQPASGILVDPAFGQKKRNFFVVGLWRPLEIMTISRLESETVDFEGISSDLGLWRAAALFWTVLRTYLTVLDVPGCF